jgi:hypothetical protein
MSKIIMGIQLKERMKDAAKFQDILSNYGCHINTRLGLHSADHNSCSPQGIIILEFLKDSEDASKDFENELKELDVTIQKMIF